MTITITTHVLDLSLGKPAEGMVVQLQQFIDGTFVDVAVGITNADGRITSFSPIEPMRSGMYRLQFDIEPYFVKSGQAESFYPSITIEFRVHASSTHYHVPLLLSPFGYSTYRGS